jgi:protein neuralized
MKFNLFPKGEFSFGSKITCVFENCNKTFRIFICPNCNNYQVETKDMLEGQIIKCMKCEIHFFSISCPHCRKNILGKNTKLSFGQSVLCPYKNCQRLFSYLYCCKCKRPLYDKNNAYSDELVVCCPYKNCKTRFINCLCPNCLRNNFTIIKSDNENQKINIDFKDLMECIHCKNKFFPQKRFNIFNDGIIMEFTQGKTIYFNDAIKEPSQAIRSKNLIPINSEIYKLIENCEKDNNKIIQLGQSVNDTTMIEQVVKNEVRIQCCFCLENKSESVFIPCGHRCVCFRCGEIIMKSQNKRCPICQEEAFYLLKKVYDS